MGVCMIAWESCLMAVCFDAGAAVFWFPADHCYAYEIKPITASIANCLWTLFAVSAARETCKTKPKFWSLRRKSAGLMIRHRSAQIALLWCHMPWD